MSEERDRDENVEKLKKELKELIDHRIEHNNGFANLLRGDYSLFISLFFLIMSVFGAWKLGFLARYYVLLVYFGVFIWLLCATINAIIIGQREREDVFKLISTNLGRIKVALNWFFKQAKPIIYSLWILFLLSLLTLVIIGEKRWWMWAPAILFVIFLPLIAEKGSKSFAALLDEWGSIEEKQKIEPERVWPIAIIMLILILAIIVIYLRYIFPEFVSIILKEPKITLILTILVLMGLAFLSEYLSMKFMVTEVSNQNYKLSALRMEINRIEDTEALEKQKKELLTWDLPKAASFLVFFNYYYNDFMPTQHTFEVGEEEEESSGV